MPEVPEVPEVPGVPEVPKVPEVPAGAGGTGGDCGTGGAGGAGGAGSIAAENGSKMYLKPRLLACALHRLATVLQSRTQFLAQLANTFDAASNVFDRCVGLRHDLRRGLASDLANGRAFNAAGGPDFNPSSHTTCNVDVEPCNRRVAGCHRLNVFRWRGAEGRHAAGEEHEHGDERPHGRCFVARSLSPQNAADASDKRTVGRRKREATRRRDCRQLGQRRDVDETVAADFHREIVAAVFTLGAHLRRHPPCGRVVEKERFDDRLQKIDHVVVASDMCELVREDCLQLVRRQTGKSRRRQQDHGLDPSEERRHRNRAGFEDRHAACEAAAVWRCRGRRLPVTATRVQQRAEPVDGSTSTRRSDDMTARARRWLQPETTKSSVQGPSGAGSSGLACRGVASNDRALGFALRSAMTQPVTADP